MKLLGRALWLLLGLIYRLIVLALFERWIPFPERPPSVPAPPERAPKAKKKKQRIAEAARPPRAPRPRAPRTEPAFLPGESSALSPELAARLEGERWQARRNKKQAPARRPAPATRESLGSLLRDERALRDAVVLGSALGARRSRS